MGADNVTLNNNTTSGKVIRAVDYGDGFARQIIQIDIGAQPTGPESIITLGNPFPVSVQGSVVIGSGTVSVSGSVTQIPAPKTPVTFRQRITATQTNFVLVTPGAAWRLRAIGITSKTYDANPGDNPSILIGVAAATTPTNSQVVFAHEAFPVGTSYFFHAEDIVAGGSGDSLLLTSGTISTDVINIFGSLYLF